MLAEDGTTLLSEPEEVATRINEFFGEVFQNEKLECEIPTDGLRWAAQEVNELTLSVSRVRDELLKLNPGKARGPDDMHGLLLKRCAHQFAYPVYLIYKKSIEEGCCPQDWKDATVIALKKVPRSKKCDDLRPVSLTCIIAKVLERLVWQEILQCLYETKFFADSQHGGLPGRSTLTNLLVTMNEITEAFDVSSKNQIDVVYLDFRKAFDSVPHQRLLKKLEYAGVRGKVLKWFESFLLGRRQRVVNMGITTEWVDVRSGIPQGTVSGPYCFLLYINDLLTNLGPSCKVLGFVDDLKLIKVVTEDADHQEMQYAIQRIECWANTWGMSLKPAKCQHLRIRELSDQSYTLSDGSGIQMVKEVRDLGIQITEDLKPNRHIALVEQKANRMIGMIKRTVVSRDREVIVPLYKSLVRPILEYASSAWSPQYIEQVEKLERIQKRCLKLIEDVGDDHSRLEERRETIDLVNCYKVVNGDFDIEMNFFDTTSGRRRSDQKWKIYKPRARTCTRKHFFSHRIVGPWNEKVGEIAERVKNTNQFKTNLRRARLNK